MDDAEMLKNTEPHDLLRFSPSININFPRNAEESTIYWAGKVRPKPLPEAALSSAAGETEKKSFWRRLFSR